jgi:DUF4097 and DUF4098 domain-containing protein YvlB
VLLTLASAMVALGLVQQTDTTVTVARGQRLEVHAHGGDIDVKTWTRNAIRVEAATSFRTEVQVSSSGPTISVQTEGRRGPPSSVDLQLTVPAWLPLDLSGVNVDVTVDGVRAPIAVETVQGEVDVNGGEGQISLQSVQGSVTLRGAKGRIEVHSVNEDVHVSQSSGEVMAESVNGEVMLDRVDATNLEASTVNGDLSYDGPIRNGGRYTLTSHNGDVTLGVPEGTSASVAVSTFSGDFESDFPVTLTETRKGKRFSFNLGSGSAQVHLESFQGTIRLVRPGSIRSSERQHDKDKNKDHDED